MFGHEVVMFPACPSHELSGALSPSPTQCVVYDAMSQEQCHNLASIDIIATELFNQPLLQHYTAMHAVIIPKKINKLYCNVVSGLLPIYTM